LTILHLGVVDYPYTYTTLGDKTKSGRAKQRRKKAGVRSVSTGDVAGFLERKYGIMQVFFDTKQEQIAKEMEESLAGALEDLLMGAPATRNPMEAASSKIETMMKEFISSGEVERVGIAGTPTEASLLRKAGRRRRYGTRGLTSFIDTGQYENAMRAWIDL
jgi:hypothetical protein